MQFGNIPRSSTAALDKLGKKRPSRLYATHSRLLLERRSRRTPDQKTRDEGRSMRTSPAIGLALLLTGSAAALADVDVAKITDVQIKRDSPDQSGIYHIKVTIEHEDTGWDHYVESWEIFAPDGQILGVRPFFEPELERLKTVSALAGVVIPEDVKAVTIRARTHPSGFEGDPVKVKIPH
jgi:hypothetical protein